MPFLRAGSEVKCKSILVKTRFHFPLLKMAKCKLYRLFRFSYIRDYIQKQSNGSKMDFSVLGKIAIPALHTQPKVVKFDTNINMADMLDVRFV